MSRFWNGVRSLLGLGARDDPRPEADPAWDEARREAAEGRDKVETMFERNALEWGLAIREDEGIAAATAGLARGAAEQREEALTGVADGLRAGGSLRAIFREAAAYGVRPEESEALRGEDGRGTAALAEMPEAERVEGLRDLLGSRAHGSIHMEDVDGEYRTWPDLSPAGRLRAVADDAAYYGVPFDAFAVAAAEHVPADALLDASLRVAFDGQRELTAIGRVLPPHDRIGEYPLVDQVKDVVAELAHAERHIRQHENDGIER